MCKIIIGHTLFHISTVRKGKRGGGWIPKGQEVSWSGKREDRWQDTQRGRTGGKKINFSDIAKYCTLDKSKEMQARSKMCGRCKGGGGVRV